MVKRQDSSGYLYHWVKAVPFQRVKEMDYSSAFEVMMQIIDDGCLRAGLTMDKGGHECICLTESPKKMITNDTSKYQPFGFQFTKRELFALGGRPVIYSPIRDKSLIDPSLHWRFMPFDLDLMSVKNPKGLDFTWEREWRLNEPELYIQDVRKIYVPNDYYKKQLIDRTNLIVQNSISDYYFGYPDQGVEQYVDDIHDKIEVLNIPD